MERDNACTYTFRAALRLPALRSMRAYASQSSRFRLSSLRIRFAILIALTFMIVSACR